MAYQNEGGSPFEEGTPAEGGSRQVVFDYWEDSQNLHLDELR
jgi:hypothetical protein